MRGSAVAGPWGSRRLTSGVSVRTATDQLKAEHFLIERAARVLECELRRIEEGSWPELGLLARLTLVFDDFMDKIHHRKEEGLFPVLEEHGVVQCPGLIGVLLLQHQQANSLWAALLTGAPSEVIEAGKAYTHLLRQHIEKEDRVLLALVDSRLPPVAREALRDRFERIDREEAGLRARVEALITDLEARRNAGEASDENRAISE